MAVRIRLLRMGKIRNPQYRIVVADARTKRDGRAIEYIGIYHPKEEPSRIEVNSERVQHWLSVGAQPSEPVQRDPSKTGDWQKFKGLPRADRAAEGGAAAGRPHGGLRGRGEGRGRARRARPRRPPRREKAAPRRPPRRPAEAAEAPARPRPAEGRGSAEAAEPAAEAQAAELQPRSRPVPAPTQQG